MTLIGETFLAQSRSLLQDYLAKIDRCLALLNEQQIWWRANPESNSIGNLLLHLSGNVRQWIVVGLGGARERLAGTERRFRAVPRDRAIGRGAISRARPITLG